MLLKLSDSGDDAAASFERHGAAQLLLVQQLLSMGARPDADIKALGLDIGLQAGADTWPAWLPALGKDVDECPVLLRAILGALHSAGRYATLPRPRTETTPPTPLPVLVPGAHVRVWAAPHNGAVGVVRGIEQRRPKEALSVWKGAIPIVASSGAGSSPP